MTKRFTDTDKWRKGFIRSLDGPYKLLWLYILDECDHAGIWHVEMDVANVRIGIDVTVREAIEAFGGRVVAFDSDKWFIPDFVAFQYGELKEVNRVHQSVARQLIKYELMGLVSPLQGLKDKEKDKDKDKDKTKRTRIAYSDEFESFWGIYPIKQGKPKAFGEWKIALRDREITPQTLTLKVSEQIEDKNTKWAGGCFAAEFPHPERWLKNRRWEDEVTADRPTIHQPERLTAGEQKVKRNKAIIDAYRRGDSG